MKKLVDILAMTAIAIVASIVIACTATTASTFAKVVADFCPAGVVLAGQGNLAPLCASIPEIEAVVAEWLAKKPTPAAPGAPAASVAPVAPPTQAELYQAVLARRAK